MDSGSNWGYKDGEWVCGSYLGRQECWEEGRGLECPGRAGEKSRVLSFPESGSWIMGAG